MANDFGFYMNQAQSPQQEMPPVTPSLIVNNAVESLQSEFQQREVNLQRQLKQRLIDENGYIKSIQGLQQDFDKQYSLLQDKQSRLERLGMMANAGLVNEEQVDEASWKTVLPKTESTVMFPNTTTREETPLSINQLGKIGEEAGAYVKSAPTEGRFLLPRFMERRTKEGLLEKYKSWRTLIGYNAMSPVRQAQVDKLWDEHAGKSKNWDAGSKEVLALRSKGKLGKAYGRRITGTLTDETDGIAPFHKSVIAEKEKGRVKELDAATAQVLLQEAGGNKDKARELARQRGYKF